MHIPNRQMHPKAQRKALKSQGKGGREGRERRGRVQGTEKAPTKGTKAGPNIPEKHKLALTLKMKCAGYTDASGGKTEGES